MMTIKRILLLVALSYLFRDLAAQDLTLDPQAVQEAERVVNEAGLEPNLEKEQPRQALRAERHHTAGVVQKAWEKASREAGTYGVTYSQKEVIRLRLREFMTTSVVLPSWEKIEEIIVGDSSTFEATRAKDNILLLKPKEFIGADSNITVVGQSGLVYTFYVRSEAFNSEHLPDLRVHVHVPGDVPMSFSLKEKGELKPASLRSSSMASDNQEQKATYSYPTNLAPRIDRLNFKWSMSGDSSIAPNQVFSDGVRTWFNYGRTLEEQDLPTIARVIDGVDTPVNTRIEGSMIIAESVGVFTLRNGNRVVCVFPSDLKNG